MGGPGTATETKKSSNSNTQTNSAKPSTGPTTKAKPLDQRVVGAMPWADQLKLNSPGQPAATKPENGGMVATTYDPGKGGPGNGKTTDQKGGTLWQQLAPSNPYANNTAMNQNHPEGKGTVEPQEEKTPLDFSRIPPYHVILEQLAHRFAYHSPNLTEADDLPNVTDPRLKKATEDDMLEAIGYKKERVIESAATGFQATLFVPIASLRNGKKVTEVNGLLPQGLVLKPVVAFRGTDGKKDLADDANEQGIGAFQFAMHMSEVRGLLGAAAGLGGPADVTGHSLGGALAQRAAASMPGLVGDVITFQAPGIGDAAKGVDPKANKSTHYTMTGDIVSMAGGERTPGDVVNLSNGKGNDPLNHMAFPLAAINETRKDEKNGVKSVHQTKGQDTTIDKNPTRESTRVADNRATRFAAEAGRMNPGKTAGAGGVLLAPFLLASGPVLVGAGGDGGLIAAADLLKERTRQATALGVLNRGKTWAFVCAKDETRTDGEERTRASVMSELVKLGWWSDDAKKRDPLCDMILRETMSHYFLHCRAGGRAKNSPIREMKATDFQDTPKANDVLRKNATITPSSRG